MPPEPPPPPRDAPPREVLPPDAVPDDAAATVGELRTVKRWLAVAGVWAVAASAIAIIALLAANDEDGPRGVTGSQLSGVQRDLDQRIDSLEEQVQDLPQAEDVSKLENRLKTAEGRASGARDDARAVNRDLDELQQRVDELQQQQEQQSGGDSGGTTSP